MKYHSDDETLHGTEDPYDDIAVDQVRRMADHTVARRGRDSDARAAREAKATHERTIGNFLELEREYPQLSGAKQEEIRIRFGYSTARYYQDLFAAIKRGEGLDIDPHLVNAIVARSDAAIASRASRTFTPTR
jgi:hypothetical protein